MPRKKKEESPLPNVGSFSVLPAEAWFVSIAVDLAAMHVIGPKNTQDMFEQIELQLNGIKACRSLARDIGPERLMSLAMRLRDLANTLHAVDKE